MVEIRYHPLSNEGSNPSGDDWPVVDDQSCKDSSYQAGEEPFYKSFPFRYFFSLFCGCMVGSLLGTILVKILAEFL